MERNLFGDGMMTNTQIFVFFSRINFIRSTLIKVEINSMIEWNLVDWSERNELKIMHVSKTP